MIVVTGQKTPHRRNTALDLQHMWSRVSIESSASTTHRCCSQTSEARFCKQLTTLSSVPTRIDYSYKKQLVFFSRLNTVAPTVTFSSGGAALCTGTSRRAAAAVTHLDHNDGQFFRAMEWLMFFLGHHCCQWFFNGFDKDGPSPLNVFGGVQPLKPMVFRWFSKF